ncbi:MAG: hypothetical protein JO352_26190 [Chloroflexi bacterium]|nr:hypothetical protein [Chloroflexota bacterium]
MEDAEHLALATCKRSVQVGDIHAVPRDVLQLLTGGRNGDPQTGMTTWTLARGFRRRERLAHREPQRVPVGMGAMTASFLKGTLGGAGLPNPATFLGGRRALGSGGKAADRLPESHQRTFSGEP